MPTVLVALGAVLAALAVAMGAFGSHALEGRLGAQMFAVYQTGVDYHFIHALGMMIAGLFASRTRSAKLVYWAGALMIGGILAFSGSLYLLAMTGARWLGLVTPVGGTAFILSWLLLALAASRR